MKKTDGFVRSPINPGAVLNTDSGALQAYRAKKQSLKRRDEEIETLKKDMSEIKGLLSILVERIK